MHAAHREGDPFGGDDRTLRGAVTTGQPLGRVAVH